MDKKDTYSLFTIKFWRAYLITMRPYLLFVSGVAGMAGVADGTNMDVFPTLGIFLVFFLSYGFGQALTDCFQMDTDSLSSPYRPLVRGIISKKQVLFVSLIGLTACCNVLFIFNIRTFILGVLSIIGLATYTFFKRKWWGGPFYNAWIVALLPIIGKMTTLGQKGSFYDAVGTGSLLFIVISVFMSYANFVLMGYFKDISADKTSGYNTFCVIFGWKKSAIASDCLALASIVATGLSLSMSIKHASIVTISDYLVSRWFSGVVFLAAVLILVIAQIGIHRIHEEEKAHKPISNVVRGFVLLHLAEICVLRPEWTIPTIIFYGGFEAVFRMRPEERQV